MIDAIKKQWRDNPLFSTALALLVMVVLQTLALGFEFDSFGSWADAFINNWVTILRNNAVIGIVSLGMTLVIISGGIDLSVGSAFVAAGALFIMLLSNNGLLSFMGEPGWPQFAVAFAAVTLFGCLLGGVNGVLTADGAIAPFIVTLGTMKIFRSVTQHMMQGSGASFPDDYSDFSCLMFGRFMVMPIIYWLGIAFLLYLLMNRTSFGTYVTAIGSNERAANLAGINVKAVKRAVYVITGALTAIAAMISIARIGSMDYANAGSGYELDAIAAVIIGGTRMSGGRGSIMGTLLGVVILAVMNNMLNLLGVPAFLREAFKGLVVLVAVLVQRRRA